MAREGVALPMPNIKFRLIIALTVLFCAVLLLPSSTSARSDEDRIKELQERMQKLDAQDSINAEKSRVQEEKSMPERSLDEIIAPWEALLKECQSSKNPGGRCADVMYTLGKFYFDKARDDYIKAREQYETAMDAWEKRRVGKEPVNPVPDYSKSLKLYQDLTKQYPGFPKLSEAYYQMGNIYEKLGDFDKCKQVYTMIADSFPESPRASMAHFKLADLAYMDHDNTDALKHYDLVKQDQVDLQVWEMTHYRRGEILYNSGEFEQAINLFETYVEQCDAGVYKSREFRSISLEYMAISFSDMANGAEACIKYFDKIGKRPYEDTVLYTVGMKNHAHGQWDDAIKALTTALNLFPYYTDAPVACRKLTECYVIKKQFDKANEEREKLIDNYGEGSKWYEKNLNNAAAREQAGNERRNTIASIALYYHALAQNKKDKGAYEKAIKRYEDFFKEFPDDKWRNYEFHYNVAEIYEVLGDYDHAAENYDYVASQDISKFPAYAQEIDTFGMSAEQIENLKRKGPKGPVIISQEDAAYNAIVSLDNSRKKITASKKLSDDQIYNLPETQSLLSHIEKFQVTFPKSTNAADLVYLAGSINYNAKEYGKAVLLFRLIIDNYPDSKVHEISLRMLANSYASLGQYESAMIMYRQLMAKQKQDSPEQLEVVDLAAGSMYKKAEAFRKDGDLGAAAKEFLAIAAEFPASQLVDKAWFQGAVCYDSMKNYETAAATYDSLPSKFVKSTLRETAYLHAAEDYKKAKRLDLAAQIYRAAADTINKPAFAIPCLSEASDCYQKLNQYDSAGRMFALIYEKFPKDTNAPHALHNAGLVYEKGKLYNNAIIVYTSLSKQFPESEDAADAFFAIGFCYEKLGKNAEMAATFSQYAAKFTNDRYKQVQALVKAGNAELNLNNPVEAEKDYRFAVSVYENFHKGNDIDVSDVAEAYCRIGDIYYGKFAQLQLEGKNENEVKERTKEKSEALKETGEYYEKAIELGVQEWTIRATYMVGQGFVDMASSISRQSLFGSSAEQIASKVKILSSLEKYYQKAEGYFHKNIEWSHTQNIIDTEYVAKSVDRFMEMKFRQGDIMEEVGRILKDAPAPATLTKDEKEAYAQVLEEKWLEALDAALPRYEQAIKAAQELGIASSTWLTKARDRVREIKPDDEALALTIVPWKPSPKPAVEKSPATVTQQKQESAIATWTPPPQDKETAREMQRLQNIMTMPISSEEKVKQLNRIESEAQRNIEMEQEKINELKQQLQ
jgi:tetratricopeptide (TPR) repeat protein